MTEASNNSCGCLRALTDNDATAIEILEKIRSDCVALQHIFLPDDTWPDFKAWHVKRDVVAEHQSVLLLALKRGHLARLTGPIHRYFIEKGTLRQDIRREYVRAMRERWMLYSDPLERHRKYRMFAGRIAELQFAEWLETTQDWTIVGLEALREGPDIEAKSTAGAITAFEVKSIGTQDDDFEEILRSMAQGASAGWRDPYDAINYLLLRVYEAAKQLARYDGYRIAVATINNDTWENFDFQLKGDWIEWSNPSFFDSSPSWKIFLKEQERRYPEIRTELPSVIRAIDEVWIMKRLNGYEYHLEYDLCTGHS
jgi:hypothetical protein